MIIWFWSEQVDNRNTMWLSYFCPCLLGPSLSESNLNGIRAVSWLICSHNLKIWFGLLLIVEEGVDEQWGDRVIIQWGDSRDWIHLSKFFQQIRLSRSYLFIFHPFHLLTLPTLPPPPFIIINKSWERKRWWR